MKTCQEIVETLFSEQDWRKVEPKIEMQVLVETLSYEKTLRMAGDLYFAESLHDDTLKEYAIILWFAISEKYPEKWSADWKNSAFLGLACQRILWRCDLALQMYEKAKSIVKDPPHTLLLLFARCDSDPKPPLSLHQRKMYTEKAYAIAKTYDTAIQMRVIYRELGNEELEAEWLQKANTLSAQGQYSPVIIPNAYKELVKHDSTCIFEL